MFRCLSLWQGATSAVWKPHPDVNEKLTHMTGHLPRVSSPLRRRDGNSMLFHIWVFIVVSLSSCLLSLFYVLLFLFVDWAFPGSRNRSWSRVSSGCCLCSSTSFGLTHIFLSRFFVLTSPLPHARYCCVNVFFLHLVSFAFILSSLLSSMWPHAPILVQTPAPMFDGLSRSRAEHLVT